MKRFAMLALVLVFAVACDDDSPTSPSDSNTRQFTAILLPQNEVPAVTSGPDAGASGTMQLTMTVTRDAANVINGATYNFTVNITGFPAPTTLTGAHIHNAAAGTNAPVVVPLALTATEVAVTTGQATITKPGQSASANANAATVAQAIFDNPGANYFNVHTTNNPGGAVRGQLVRSN